MAECTISVYSSCEEVAECLKEIGKLNDKEKNILIQEGISGDVLLGFSIFFKVIGIIPGHANKIIKFLDANKEKFQPKPIDENISIKNEEDIKSFFEKYIGFKGNLDNIKGENELKNLNEEDMKYHCPILLIFINCNQQKIHYSLRDSHIINIINTTLFNNRSLCLYFIFIL